MQVRRGREEGSEAPGFVCRWWAIEKPSAQMTLPPFTPCRAMKAGRNQHVQIRSQESAVRNQGGYVHSPSTMAVATWCVLIERFAFMKNMTRNPSGV